MCIKMCKEIFNYTTQIYYNKSNNFIKFFDVIFNYNYSKNLLTQKNQIK